MFNFPAIINNDQTLNIIIKFAKHLSTVCQMFVKHCINVKYSPNFWQTLNTNI